LERRKIERNIRGTYGGHMVSFDILRGWRHILASLLGALQSDSVPFTCVRRGLISYRSGALLIVEMGVLARPLYIPFALG